MNITFIIGNGFDINIGAKTSYKDFYKSLTPDDIIENDIYRDIIQFKVPESIKNNELIDKYTQIKEKDDTGEEEWRIFKSKREIENIEEFEETKKLLERYNYKLESNFDKWSDLEMGIGKYLKKIMYENIEEFFEDYEKLRDDLENYLRSQEKNLNSYDNESNIKVLEKSLAGFYNFLTEKDKDDISKILEEHNYGIKYNFISFNYTNFLDEFVDLAYESEVLKTRDINGTSFKNRFSNVIHIHGTLDEGMIIGVDNEDQIFNERIKNRDEMKFFIKPSCNDELRNKRNEFCENIIDSSDIICLFGVSIGETDKKWWNKINDWLTNTSKENRRLIIYGYKSDFKKNDIRQRIKIPKEIKNDMKKYLGKSKIKTKSVTIDFSKTDKELEKNKEFDKKVKVALNTDIFKFNVTNMAIG